MIRCPLSGLDQQIFSQILPTVQIHLGKLDTLLVSIGRLFCFPITFKEKGLIVAELVLFMQVRECLGVAYPAFALLRYDARSRSKGALHLLYDVNMPFFFFF